MRGFALKLLKILRCKPKSVIEQHFWDKLKLKKNTYLSKELSPRRKASLKVRKMTLFFSRHNSYCVWERSAVNSKANFFAWKVGILNVFRKKYSRLAYLFYILPQSIYLSRDGTEKQCWKKASSALQNKCQNYGRQIYTYTSESYWLATWHYFIFPKLDARGKLRAVRMKLLITKINYWKFFLR